MKKILLARGKLAELSAVTGLSKATCSKYLRGMFDHDNEAACETAIRVRNQALEIGGVASERNNG